MDLFEQELQRRILKTAPLADRLRPKRLEDFVGQKHILGKGRLLRRAIEADRISSLIFYGPPGTGKTTLAQIIAHHTQSYFTSLNAVLAGVKDLRKVVEEAKERRHIHDKRTILFIDEVHRWNKSQQDALLPWVEKGVIILIGATTENPYFEVIRPLVSRSRIFQLFPLTEEDLSQLLDRALHDKESGYGNRRIEIFPEARSHLIRVANGDGRSLLNALELAVETTPPNQQGIIEITLEVAEESIQKRAVLYDKEGDAHYDTISAFIKSLRGSDPDGALYWLAKMVYSGEDPRYIFRRMLILAAEDVGLADPQAIQVVNACAQAFDYVGFPEGSFHLAEAALYLATARKSNSTLAFFDALKTIEEDREGEVPRHLKDANRDKEGFGHGKGYLYPHAYQDHWVAQNYLPKGLQGKIFYKPSLQGYEGKIHEEVKRRKEIQLSLPLEEFDPFTGREGQSVYSAKKKEKWFRAVSRGLSEELFRIQEAIVKDLPISSHHLLLLLNPPSPFLAFPLISKISEGGLFIWLREEEKKTIFLDQWKGLDYLDYPEFWIDPKWQRMVDHFQKEEILFDYIISWRGVLEIFGQGEILEKLSSLIKPKGKICLGEKFFYESSRPSHYLEKKQLSKKLWKKFLETEEKVYSSHPLLSWTETKFEKVFEAKGFKIKKRKSWKEEKQKPLTQSLLEHWFSPEEGSYASWMRPYFSKEEWSQIRKVFFQSQGKEILWCQHISCILGEKKS
nr:MAG: AAA family ATPase [Planctomycetota bacterium]